MTEKRKNLFLLLAGLEQFFIQHPERIGRTRLLLAGPEGFGADEIRRQIDLFNQQWFYDLPASIVEYLGEISETEKWSLLQSASVFVLPSWTEGFGLPLLEALALGRPVVATRVGALPEIGGEAVWYVEPDDPKALALALAQILLLPEAAAGAAALGRAQAAKFTWLKSANQVWSIAQELLAKNKIARPGENN